MSLLRPTNATEDSIAMIVTGATITLGMTVAGVVTSYAVQLLLARWMGISSYGIYVYVWSWAILLAVIAGIGFPSALVRFIPQYESDGDLPHLRGLLRYAFWCTTGCGSLIAALGSSVVIWLKASQNSASLLLSLWAVPLIAMTTLFSEALRARGRVILAYAPIQLIRPSALILVATIIFYTTGPLGIAAAVLATLSAHVFVLSFQITILRRAVGIDLRRTPPAYDLVTWLDVALPLGVAAALTSIFEQTPTILLGLLSSSEDVSVYFVAARSATLISFVLTSVNALAAPAFARAYWRGEIGELQRLLSRLAHIIFWPSLIVALAIWIFSRPILQIFGVGFVAGRSTMLVLVVGQVVNAAAGSVGHLLQMTGHQIANLYVLLASALFNVILNLILIPWLGCLGAGIAGAVTTIVWNVWLHYLVIRRLGVHPSIVAALSTPLRKAA
jgi:O-antigen/teichoic acid export membrane protein